MSFKRIVVGTDGGDTASVAVAQTVGLASRLGAVVVVVTVYHEESGEAVARGLLRDVQRTHGEAADLELVARHGAPADAILAAAEDAGADLVVVGNRGLTGGRVLGGVPDRVSHQAPCSVLIADTRWAAILPSGEDPHERRAPDRVLIATDGSPTAELAVDEGVGLARALGAEGLLLFVGEEGQGGRILRRATERLGEDGLKTMVTGGDPPSRIVDVAKEEDCQLIVVGSKGMRGLLRVFLGGVPNFVTRHAPCSVLVVKTS